VFGGVAGRSGVTVYRGWEKRVARRIILLWQKERESGYEN
jgi:hypothetical protein